MDKDGQGLADKGWRAGETFFEESGGRPAQSEGADESDQGVSQGGTSLPASEEDSRSLQEDTKSEPQSWPGSGGPGTFPPPG